MFFNVVLLLACCATIATAPRPNAQSAAKTSTGPTASIASANPAASATSASAGPTVRTRRTDPIYEIHAILEKLFVPSGNLRKYQHKAPPEVIKDALGYAYWYSRAVRVPSVLQDGESPVFDPCPFWDETSFKLRVHNFDLEGLPAPEQYAHMARALVDLLEFIKLAWGGHNGALEWVEEKRNPYPQPYCRTAAEIKSTLEAKIKELGHQPDDFNDGDDDEDVISPRPPRESAPMMGEGEKSTLVDGEASGSMLAQLNAASYHFQKGLELLGDMKGLLQRQTRASPPPSQGPKD